MSLCPLYCVQVRPELAILDYHTEFSGITAEQLVNVSAFVSSLCLVVFDRCLIGVCSRLRYG